ncbi:MAG: hypothetical protein AB1627_02520 [Chloroflexota bacterium]
MRICSLCTDPRVRAADARLAAGQSQRSVAKWLGLDYQVVGRHVRNGHVMKGNPVHGRGWAKEEEPPAEVTVKGWQLQGFETEDDWLQSIADTFGGGLTVEALKAHIAAGHHLA